MLIQAMSNPKDVINRLLGQSAEALVRASSLLSDAEFFAQPEIGASMAWTLLHLASYQNWFISIISPNYLCKHLELRSDIFKGGRPFSEEDIEHYRSKAETIQIFLTTQAQLLDQLAAFDVSQWDQPAPNDTPFPTLGSIWENIATENYWHLGQLSVSVPRLGACCA